MRINTKVITKNRFPNIGLINKSDRANIWRNVFSFPYLSGVIFDTLTPLEIRKSLKELIDISLRIIATVKIIK